MSGIEFLSRILGLQGLIIRKNASNRQASLDLSSAQQPNTSVEVLMPYNSGTLMLAPAVEGVNGQVLKTNGNGTTEWIAIPSAPVTSVNSQTGAVSITTLNIGAVSVLEKGVANGVATLGADGIVPYAQLPAIPGVPAPIDFYGSVTSNLTSGSVFTVNSNIYRGFIAQVSVFVDDSVDLSETFMILGANNGSSWFISPPSAGNNSGVTFTIDSAGVLSFADSLGRQKTIAYNVQAIDRTLESYGRRQERGSINSSLGTGSVFTVNSNIYRSFTAQVSVFVDDSTDLSETFQFLAANTGSSWFMSQIGVGDSSGVTFSIDASGTVSFSGQDGKPKRITYHYDAIDNFIGKIITTATSGAVTTVSPAAFRAFTAQVSVFVDDSEDLAETFYLMAAYNGTSWIMSDSSTGNSSGVSFTVDSNGVLSFSGSSAQKTISYRVEPIAI
jgi:hypothetical protein